MKKTGIIFFIILFLLMLFWFIIPKFFVLSLPRQSGSVVVNNLRDTVRVYYNSKAFPSIFANNESDLYFALGWHHAGNRLFQMELLRQISRGRLKEFIHEAPLQIDIENRRLGFYRKVQTDVKNLSPSSRHILTAYCAGINSFIVNTPLLPPEFVLLNYQPEEWKPEDVLLVGLYQSWFSHALMDQDRNFQRLQSIAGSAVDSILSHFKTFSPATLPSALRRPYTIAGLGTASNSWVVSPAHSASGAAMHASDPHLMINMFPGFWYGAGLHCPDFNFAGITAAGLPMAIMGHTDDIAYGFTVSSVDVVDYYAFQKDSSGFFAGPDSLFRPDTLMEYFYLSADSMHVEKILITPYGPVVEADSAKIIVLHWSGFDFSSTHFIDAALQLPKSTDFCTFQKTVTRFSALDANWTYSDRHGNIGYQLGISVPQRHVSNSFCLLDGSQPKNFWQGYRSLSNTPAVFNPPQGFLATCNNQIISPLNDDTIPGFYDPYRIIKATEFLQQDTLFTINFFKNMQMDAHSGSAAFWKQLFYKSALACRDDAHLETIRQWDGNIRMSSHVAALYELWWYFCGKFLFADEHPAGWKSFYAFQDEVLLYNISELIDDKNTFDSVESILDISCRAYRKALSIADNLTWDQMSRLQIRHLFSDNKLIDWWLHLSRNAGPMSGDPGSLHANWFFYNEEQGIFKTIVGPSMRFVLDWSVPDSFQLCLFPGQSGNPLSPHYADLIDDWRAGRYQTIPLSLQVIRHNCVDSLLLIPAQ